jgi:hypothetical protein
LAALAEKGLPTRIAGAGAVDTPLIALAEHMYIIG